MYDVDMSGTPGDAAGEFCNSSIITKTVSSWARDNENGGMLTINPAQEDFCVDDSAVGFQFQDATFPNCEVSVEPDRPNPINPLGSVPFTEQM